MYQCVAHCVYHIFSFCRRRNSRQGTQDLHTPKAKKVKVDDDNRKDDDRKDDDAIGETISDASEKGNDATGETISDASEKGDVAMSETISDASEKATEQRRTRRKGKLPKVDIQVEKGADSIEPPPRHAALVEPAARKDKINRVTFSDTPSSAVQNRPPVQSNWFDDNIAMMNEGVLALALQYEGFEFSPLAHNAENASSGSGSSSWKDNPSQRRGSAFREAPVPSEVTPSMDSTEEKQRPVDSGADASSLDVRAPTPVATALESPKGPYTMHGRKYDHGFCRDRFQAWRLELNKPGAVKEWSDNWDPQPNENGMDTPWVRYNDETIVVEVPQITVDDVKNRKAGRDLDRAPKSGRNTASGVGKPHMTKLIKADLATGVMPDGVCIELKYAPENRKPSPLIIISVNGKQRCQTDILQCKGIEAALTIAHMLFEELVNGNTDIMDVYSRRNTLMEELQHGNIVVNRYYVAYEHFGDERVLGQHPKDPRRLLPSGVDWVLPGMNGGAPVVVEEEEGEEEDASEEEEEEDDVESH